MVSDQRLDKHSASVLLADDDPTTTRLLTVLLGRDGHRVTSSVTGQEAIERVLELRPDLLLLDVGLPDIDGYEVCRRVRAHPELAELPIIMVTSLNDRSSRLQGIEAGADDFISKPFDHVELAARVRTVTRLNRYRRLQDANRLRLEFETAAAIQQRLLPRSNPEIEGLEVIGRSRPTTEVGGDYFDFMARDGDLHFLLADASGHGLASALFVSTARSTVRALLPMTNDLLWLARALNNRMVEDAGDSGMFLTMVMGAFDHVTGSLTLVNCGHPPPMLLTNAGEITELQATAQPIGMIEQLDPELTTLTLNRGDLLVLYTDGLIEAQGASRELLGIAPVRELVLEHRRASLDEIAGALVDRAVSHHGSAALEDDLTLVLLRRT